MQRVSQYIAALSGIKHRVRHMKLACADPEGDGGGGVRGQGSRPPLENHKYIQGLLAILVRVPLKITKLPSSARQLNAI